jgi:thiamine-monophosphate kinase
VAKDRAARPGEFALIARYFRPLATDPGAFALMDDAAAYQPPEGEEVVLKTDLIAEGIHFLPEDPPGAIAKKALRVNLSDLAAKGATPVGYLLSIALPSTWTEAWVKDFTQGLKQDQEHFEVTLFGGDTNRSPGGLIVSVAAIGRVPRGEMVLRSGARPGDLIFVSGTIGDAALGLRLRLGTLDATPAGEGAAHLLDRYLHPQPRLALGPVLRRHATSAMDVSDGLVGDFAHIGEASGVGGEIEAALVPLSDPARALIHADDTVLRSVLTGGDDYEILATVTAASASAFMADAAEVGVPVTRIGRVVEGGPEVVVSGVDGRPLELSNGGHTHF